MDCTYPPAGKPLPATVTDWKLRSPVSGVTVTAVDGSGPFGSNSSGTLPRKS